MVCREERVTYKAYLYSNDTYHSEVKKFLITSPNVNSYSHLQEKLTAAFPELATTGFSVHYRDRESDLVKIGSDEELSIFLLETTNERKIHVSQNGKSARAEPESNGKKLHPGVVCDGCDGEVEGYRYKCTNCRNYDLCSTCEARGIHSEHLMLRIPEPTAIAGPMGRKFHKGFQKCLRRQEKCKFARGNWGPGVNPHASTSMNDAAMGWVDSLSGLINGILDNVLIDPSPMETDNNATKPQETQTQDAATPMQPEVQVPAPTQSAPSQGLPPENAKSPDQSRSPSGERGWVLVGGVSQPESAQTGSKEKEQASTSQQPTQMGPTSIVDRVNDSLEKMLSMGFNNEGDWLRQMLLYKNGDIEKVLDILLPMRKLTPN